MDVVPQENPTGWLLAVSMRIRAACTSMWAACIQMATIATTTCGMWRVVAVRMAAAIRAVSVQ